MNAIGRIGLALTYFTLGRLADAHAEALKILELEETQAFSSALLALTYSREGKWEKSLSFAERASFMIPWSAGIFAGVLQHIGEQKRAEEQIQRLMHSDSHVATVGLSFYHYVCGEHDKAADWWEKVIRQRYINAAVRGLMLFRSSPRWPELARLMNLPEKAL